MNEFIEWFNGKKTAIGTIASLIVTYLYEEQYIDNYLAALLAGVSVVVFGVGAGHKVIKYRKKVADKSKK